MGGWRLPESQRSDYEMTHPKRAARSRMRVIIIGLSALALLSAACSSSPATNSGGGDPGSISGSTAAGGSTWVIGNIGSNSGQASSTFAAAKPALEAWASWTNAHGGIDGHQIKVVYADDQNQPSLGLS